MHANASHGRQQACLHLQQQRVAQYALTPRLMSPRCLSAGGGNCWPQRRFLFKSQKQPNLYIVNKGQGVETPWRLHLEGRPLRSFRREQQSTHTSRTCTVSCAASGGFSPPLSGPGAQWSHECVVPGPRSGSAPAQHRASGRYRRSAPVMGGGRANRTNMSTAATPCSNDQFDAAAFVSRDVEEDPLGILRKVPSGHERVDETTGSRRLLEPAEELMRAAAECGNGNPCDVIEAILRSSQAIRDRVSSRQVCQKHREAHVSINQVALRCI